MTAKTKDRAAQAAARAAGRETAKLALQKRGLNVVDMRDDGGRWQLLSAYGYPFGTDGFRAIADCLTAWQVVESHQVAGGVPTSEGGPAYMLKFQDGLWRYATFRGLNGAPCASCGKEAFEGPTGAIAHVRYELWIAEMQETYAREALRAAEDQANVHREALREALDEFQRRTGPEAGPGPRPGQRPG